LAYLVARVVDHPQGRSVVSRKGWIIDCAPLTRYKKGSKADPKSNVWACCWPEHMIAEFGGPVCKHLGNFVNSSSGPTGSKTANVKFGSVLEPKSVSPGDLVHIPIITMFTWYPDGVELRACYDVQTDGSITVPGFEDEPDQPDPDVQITSATPAPPAFAPGVDTTRLSVKNERRIAELEGANKALHEELSKARRAYSERQRLSAKKEQDQAVDQATKNQEGKSAIAECARLSKVVQLAETSIRKLEQSMEERISNLKTQVRQLTEENESLRSRDRTLREELSAASARAVAVSSCFAAMSGGKSASVPHPPTHSAPPSVPLYTQPPAQSAPQPSYSAPFLNLPSLSQQPSQPYDHSIQHQTADQFVSPLLTADPPVQSSQFCRHCGYQLLMVGTFCPKCGKAL